MLSAFLSGRFKAESGHKILGHHKADLPVNQHMAPFSRYAQHLHPRSVRIQRHRVNTGRSLPSQIGALPIGILNRHLGQHFGLLVFGRVKIEELIFHISFKIADSNLAPSVVPFLNDCNRTALPDSFRCFLCFESFACSRKTIQSNLNQGIVYS